MNLPICSLRTTPLTHSLAWIVAAFLPLPPKPNSESASDLERALKVRTYDIEQRRYENARWWRNLNRVMIPLGIVIIALIVSVEPVTFFIHC